MPKCSGVTPRRSDALRFAIKPWVLSSTPTPLTPLWHMRANASMAGTEGSTVTSLSVSWPRPSSASVMSSSPPMSSDRNAR